MAKSDRKLAKAQAHGGPFQDHRGGVEAKEGLLSSFSFIIFLLLLELTEIAWHSIQVLIKISGVAIPKQKNIKKNRYINK